MFNKFLCRKHVDKLLVGIMVDTVGICDRVENACFNNYYNLNDKKDVDNENSRLVLFLNIADYINMQKGEGDSARNVVFTIAKLISSSNVDQTVKLNAIKLLDLLVKNCGYPVHLHISRRGFLQVINNQFPPIRQTAITEDNSNSHNDLGKGMTISNNYSIVQSELLKELNIWYHTICQWTSYKNDLVYIKHLYNMILDRGYLYPPLNDKELAILKPYSYIDEDNDDNKNNTANDNNNMVMNIRSFEEFNNEQIIILNSQITELRRRGKEKDIKASDILANKLKKFKSNKITSEAKNEILNKVKDWNHILLKWNQKLDKLLLKDDDQPNYQLTDIEDNKLQHFIDYLKQVQDKIQNMLMEDINDETFINKLFMFNDTILRFFQRAQSNHEKLLKKITEKKNNEIERNFEQNPIQNSLDDDLISNTKDNNNDTKQKLNDGVANTDKLKITNVEISTKKESKFIDMKKSSCLNNNEKNTNSDNVKDDEKKEKFDNSYNGGVCSPIGKRITSDKDDKALSTKMINKKENRDNVEPVNNNFNTQKKLNLNTEPKLDVQKTPLGLMFKTKLSNSTPVITYAVSKAETNGQFKFDGNANEITTHFKPFLDNP